MAQIRAGLMVAATATKSMTVRLRTAAPMINPSNTRMTTAINSLP